MAAFYLREAGTIEVFGLEALTGSLPLSVLKLGPYRFGGSNRFVTLPTTAGAHRTIR